MLGQSVMFQCTATGDIQPTFQWTRNGDDINGGELSVIAQTQGNILTQVRDFVACTMVICNS